MSFLGYINLWCYSKVNIRKTIFRSQGIEFILDDKNVKILRGKTERNWWNQINQGFLMYNFNLVSFWIRKNRFDTVLSRKVIYRVYAFVTFPFNLLYHLIFNLCNIESQRTQNTVKTLCQIFECSTSRGRKNFIYANRF